MESTVTGTIRTWRDVPPTHYTLKIDAFSLFLSNDIDTYETSMFESGGYKWKLSLYPNGNSKRNVTDHISLYLGIADSDTLPSGWLINVSFKFFLYNHITHKYLTFQAVEEVTTRLFMLNTEVGFDELVSLETLKNPSNGFLLDDSCIFGAEVFVLKFSGHGECVSMIKDPLNNTFSWEIPNFSQITEEVLYSDEFVVGDYKWTLKLNPRGATGVKGEYISLYMLLVDNLPSNSKVLADYVLRIKNRHITNDKQKQGKNWFYGSMKGWGFSKFMSSSDLNDQSNSYLVNGKNWFYGSMKGWGFSKFMSSSNLNDQSNSYLENGKNWFYGSMKGWGFSKFMSSSNLNDQSNSYLENGKNWFYGSMKGWGFSKFMSSSDLNDQSNSYLVNGTLTVEAKFTLVSKHKFF